VTGGTALAVNNFGDTRSGGLAGPMALLFILLLTVATVLLIRNMNARLRRLPEKFPGQEGSEHADRPDRSEPGDPPDRDGRLGPDRTGAGPG
jgi:hypothetical protein